MALTERIEMIGRDQELSKILDKITFGHSVLIYGESGIGKKTFLKNIESFIGDNEWKFMKLSIGEANKAGIIALIRQLYDTINILLPKSLASELSASAKIEYKKATLFGSKLPWKYISKPIGQLNIAQLKDLIVASINQAKRKDRLGNRKLIFIIEDLKVTPTIVKVLSDLFPHTQVMCCLEKEFLFNNSLQPLISTFPKTNRYELKPLSIGNCHVIVENWLETQDINFDKDSTKEHYVKWIAIKSNGVPSAIENMLLMFIDKDDVIALKDVRKLETEVGVQRFDMTIFIAILGVFFMAMRYVARGAGQIEWTILAGIGSAIILLYMMFRSKLKCQY